MRYWQLMSVESAGGRSGVRLKSGRLCNPHLLYDRGCRMSSISSVSTGVKYGYRAQDAEDLHTMYKRSRSQGFGPEVKRRIIMGSFVLSSGYYDAYLEKALRVKR